MLEIQPWLLAPSKKDFIGSGSESILLKSLVPEEFLLAKALATFKKVRLWLPAPAPSKKAWIQAFSSNTVHNVDF